MNQHNELTAEQVVQALRNCLYENSCKGCPFEKYEEETCFDELHKAAADKLQQAQARIDELEAALT